MTDFKYGKLTASRPHGLDTLSAYSVGKLPAPPASVEYGGSIQPTGWGELGNADVGDCTMAGAAHLLMAFDAEVAEKDAIPSEQQVVNEYFRLSGGVDSGLNETDVLTTWHRSGLWGGQKIAGFAPVEPKNITELHQAIALYGGAYLGIACPDSAQEQFREGKPWTVVPGAKIEGGHCIVAVGYDATSVHCVTWGAEIEVTYPFLAKYMDEAWAVLSHQYVEAGHGPALDLASLQADLAAI